MTLATANCVSPILFYFVPKFGVGFLIGVVVKRKFNSLIGVVLKISDTDYSQPNKKPPFLTVSFFAELCAQASRAPATTLTSIDHTVSKIDKIKKWKHFLNFIHTSLSKAFFTKLSKIRCVNVKKPNIIQGIEPCTARPRLASLNP